MALDAVVFPKYPFGCTVMDWNCYTFERLLNEDEEKDHDRWSLLKYSNASNVVMSSSSAEETTAPTGKVVAAAEGRKKRRRVRSMKNKEEVEHQRMTHIAVERNRRKVMNEHLFALRSLMPPSYVQRGDQASIIGGAINFVKELEQLVQSLEARKQRMQQNSTSPFARFFTFPQFSSSISNSTFNNTILPSATSSATTSMGNAVADIEASVVDRHVNLKIFGKKQPKQLLQVVVGLQNLRLTALHLNVTTLDQLVLYSFSLKMEEDCHLTSVDEIASAVHGMLQRFQKEDGFN